MNAIILKILEDIYSFFRNYVDIKDQHRLSYKLILDEGRYKKITFPEVKNDAIIRGIGDFKTFLNLSKIFNESHKIEFNEYI